ncbi:hypothetical protein CPB85DRAFT_1257898, partial [Mucidula mucida]
MAIQLLDRRDFGDKLAVPWVFVKRRLPNAYYIASETIVDGNKRGVLSLRVAEKASQERVVAVVAYAAELTMGKRKCDSDLFGGSGLGEDDHPLLRQMLWAVKGTRSKNLIPRQGLDVNGTCRITLDYYLILSFQLSHARLSSSNHVAPAPYLPPTTALRPTIHINLQTLGAARK